MEIKHMEPFVQETINTFEVLLGVRPQEKELSTKDCPNGTYDVSAFIGLSGPGTGGVVLSFPEDVACKVVSRMLGEEIKEVNQDVSDGLGELVNIITGNAKRSCVKYGFQGISLSLPNVVVGKHRTVWRTKDMPCLVKKFFSSDLGPFCIEVNLRASTQE